MNKKFAQKKFLIEHNKLSPSNLQATTSLLSRFRKEMAYLFKDMEWSIPKHRRQFIFWLTSLSSKEKEEMK
jgi:hypothetical protein